MWDIRSNLGVATSGFYRSILRVVNALNEKFHVDLDLSDLKKLENLELCYA